MLKSTQFKYYTKLNYSYKQKKDNSERCFEEKKELKKIPVIKMASPIPLHSLILIFIVVLISIFILIVFSETKQIEHVENTILNNDLNVEKIGVNLLKIEKSVNRLPSILTKVKHNKTQLSYFPMNYESGFTNIKTRLSQLEAWYTIVGDSSRIVIEGDYSQTQVATGRLWALNRNFPTTIEWNTNVSQNSNIGVLSINSDGKWSYSLANSDIAYLTNGEQKIERFTVITITGLEKEIVITVIGSNNSALFSGKFSDSVTKDVSSFALSQSNYFLETCGYISVTDYDAQQSNFSNVVTNVGSVLGTLSLNVNTGKWDYTVKNSLITADSIDVFHIMSIDGTVQLITITLIYVNTKPTFSGDLTKTITKNVNNPNTIQTVSGVIRVTDSDGEESSFSDMLVSSNFGTVTLSRIDNEITWSYSILNSAIISSRSSDKFTVASIDGTTQDVVITLVYVNTPATFSGDLIKTITKDVTQLTSSQSVGGIITVTDLDGEESSFSDMLTYPEFGTLTLSRIDNEITWSYSILNSAITSSRSSDKFTVASIDGTTQDVVITLVYVNTPATFSGDLTKTITKNVTTGILNTTSVISLTVFDTDAGETGFSDTIVKAMGTIGTLSLIDNVFIYTVSNSLLAEDITDKFTISSIDGTTQDIFITVEWANTPATIGGVLSGFVSKNTNVDEDGYITITGTATIEDPDSEEVVFYELDDISSLYGILTMTSNGNWVYKILNSSIIFNSTDIFYISTIGGTLGNITIKIYSTPFIINTKVRATYFVYNNGQWQNEDSIGNLLSNDDIYTDLASIKMYQNGEYVDVGQISGNYGSLTVNVNGDYVYSSNSNVPPNNSFTSDDFPYLVTLVDGRFSFIDLVIVYKILLTGGDAIAVASVASGNMLNNDTVELDDIDTIKVKFSNSSEYSNAESIVYGNYGSLTFTNFGQYTYIVNSNLSNSNGNNNRVDIFSYLVTLKNGLSSSANLTVTIFLNE